MRHGTNGCYTNRGCRCEECTAATRAYKREYNARRREAGKTSQTAEYAARNRAALAEIKVSRGCADCGFNAHSAALDFDHRPGETKAFTVGTMVGRSLALERLLAEIEKCDVVCANCHRIRTAERRRAA